MNRSPGQAAGNKTEAIGKMISRLNKSGGNIVLIGMPYSGKSTLGRSLANLCRLPFYDTDEITVSRLELSIADIFARHGEAFFREEERRSACSLLEQAGSVIALGGGLLDSALTDGLKKNGVVIWLDVPSEELLSRRRISAGEARPLIASEDDLKTLRQVRRPRYAGLADIAFCPVGGDAALSLLDRLILREKASLGLLGRPVCHSLSPVIYRALGRMTGLEIEYAAISADERTVSARISGLRERGFKGFNLTMPLKLSAPADALRGAARRTGAVNTAVWEDGALIGYNTDGGGFMAAARKLDTSGPAYIIGAGGAALAVADALLNAGREVTVLAPRPEEEASVSARLPGARFLPLSRLQSALPPDSLIINATPLGMEGRADFEDFGFLNHAEGVFDLVYHPRRTALLRAAEKRGIKAAGGMDMLLYQAIIAFELFCGVKLNREKAFAFLSEEISAED